MNQTLEAMPLAKTYLCIDCVFVGSDSAMCSKCGSRVLLSLAQVLDRRELPNSVQRLLEEQEVLGA